jgi:hypothetical protein
MDKASMFISKVGRPFKVIKEMHLALYRLWPMFASREDLFVADLSTSTSMCYSLKNSFIIFTSNFFSNHLSPCRQQC